MPHGSVARRAVLGIVAVVSILASSAGCQRLSVARYDASTLPPLPLGFAVGRHVGADRAREPGRPRAGDGTPDDPARTRAGRSADGPARGPGLGLLADPHARRRTGPRFGHGEGGGLAPADLGAADVRAEARPHAEEPVRPVPEPAPTSPGPDANTVVLPSLPLSTAKPDATSTDAIKASATAILAAPGREPTAAPRPIKPDRPAEPAETWREGLERLKRLARAGSGESGESAGVWTLRARLLDWLEETSSEADPGPLWRTVVATLAGQEAAEERTRGDHIRRVVRAIEDQAPLEITDLRLCRKVNGFGSFEPIDPSACKPGQAVIVYCELAGLRYEEAGEMFRSRLASRYELGPSPGGDAVAKQSLGTADDLCRRRRRDYYVCYRINLPDGLAPGSYELRLTQDDLVAGRSTSLSVPLTVQP